MCSANCSIDSLEIWVQSAYWPPQKIAVVGGFFGSWHHNPSPVDSWNHGSGTHPILWLNVENASFLTGFRPEISSYLHVQTHPIPINFPEFWYHIQRVDTMELELKFYWIPSDSSSIPVRSMSAIKSHQRHPFSPCHIISHLQNFHEICSSCRVVGTRLKL